MSEKSSFALIIPCYNEEEAIPAFKAELIEFIAQFNSYFEETQLRVVFVDNGSSDHSLRLLNKISEELPIHVITCATKGYGAALRAGFASIDSNWYGFADLDNTYPLKDFVPMFQLALKKNLQIVYANRLFYQTEMPASRLLGNQLYAILTKWLFKENMQDICSGMRIFNKSCLETILKIKSNGLRFSIEFTAISLKLKWLRSEIPIHYRERIGNSKLSVVKDGLLFLFSLLKIRWFYR